MARAKKGAPVVRSILAVLGGAATAFILIGLLEMVEMMIYPPPRDLDFSKPELVRAAMEKMPVGALVCVLTAQLVGTLAGAFCAAFIARRAPRAHALIVGVIGLLASIGNMLLIPHPLWFWIASLVLTLPAAHAGGMLSRRSNADPRIALPLVPASKG